MVLYNIEKITDILLSIASQIRSIPIYNTKKEGVDPYINFLAEVRLAIVGSKYLYDNDLCEAHDIRFFRKIIKIAIMQIELIEELVISSQKVVSYSREEMIGLIFNHIESILGLHTIDNELKNRSIYLRYSRNIFELWEVRDYLVHENDDRKKILDTEIPGVGRSTKSSRN